MKGKEVKIKDVASIFLYYDGKNYVYCGPFSRTGYILTNKEAKAFTIYTGRFYLPLSLSILVFIMTNSLIISIIGLIILFVVMEIMFRRNVLSKCPIINNFNKPTKNSVIDKITTKFSSSELVVPLILLILLAVAIPVNAKLSNFNENVLIMNYIASGLIGLVALFVLICIIRIRKRK